VPSYQELLAELKSQIHEITPLGLGIIRAS